MLVITFLKIVVTLNAILCLKFSLKLNDLPLMFELTLVEISLEWISPISWFIILAHLILKIVVAAEFDQFLKAREWTEQLYLIL